MGYRTMNLKIYVLIEIKGFKVLQSSHGIYLNNSMLNDLIEILPLLL